MLQQHWEELTFEQKNLQNLWNSLCTEEHRQACQGWHRTSITFVKMMLGMRRTAQRWIHRVLQALPHPSALSCLRVQEHTTNPKGDLFPPCQAQLSLIPQHCCISGACRHPLPTWSPENATSTVRDWNPLQWLNKCCWKYPQQEANTFCDLEKLKIIKGDDWE